MTVLDSQNKIASPSRERSFAHGSKTRRAVRQKIRRVTRQNARIKNIARYLDVETLRPVPDREVLIGTFFLTDTRWRWPRFRCGERLPRRRASRARPGAAAFVAPQPRARRTAVRTVGQGSAGGSARPRAVGRTPGGRGARGEEGRNARIAWQSVPGGAAGAMTSASEALAALPPFQVMSRVDLKVAAGGFKDSWKLGQGLRCVRVRAPPVRHGRRSECSPVARSSPIAGVSRGLERERVLPARPSRAHETALVRAARRSRRAAVEEPRLCHPPRARSASDASLTTHGSIPLENVFDRSFFAHFIFPPRLAAPRFSSFSLSGGTRTRAPSRPSPWR